MRDVKILNFDRSTTGTLTSLGTTDTDLYIVPDGKTTTITIMHGTNTNANTATFSLKLSLKPTTGVNTEIVIASTQKVEGTSTTAGGGIWDWEIPIKLSAGDKIVGSQVTSGAITILIHGWEE